MRARVRQIARGTIRDVNEEQTSEQGQHPSDADRLVIRVGHKESDRFLDRLPPLDLG